CLRRWPPPTSPPPRQPCLGTTCMFHPSQNSRSKERIWPSFWTLTRWGLIKKQHHEHLVSNFPCRRNAQQTSIQHGPARSIPTSMQCQCLLPLRGSLALKSINWNLKHCRPVCA
ncbi:unnamed protein product, partial [Ectocarpus sp. 12 AP-2014]